MRDLSHLPSILWACGVVGIARVTEDHEASVRIGSGPQKKCCSVDNFVIALHIYIKKRICLRIIKMYLKKNF